MKSETIYVAPTALGMGSQFKIYALPYPMRQGQSPRDIAERYRPQWREIGTMNSKMEIVCLAKSYQPYREDIKCLGVGDFCQIEKQQSATDQDD